MDVLKDKQYKDYNYLSRYESFPYYFHSIDRKYIYGTTSQLDQNLSYNIFSYACKVHNISEEMPIEMQEFDSTGHTPIRLGFTRFIAKFST